MKNQNRPSSLRAVAATAGAFGASLALAIVLTAVHPGAAQSAAQWNEIPAPTGDKAVARFTPGGYRAEVIDIPIPGGDGDLEYKLQMKKGDTVVYSWEAMNLANPDQLYAEFHGHTEPAPGQPGDLMYYRKETGAKESGVFTAPWDGIHGWYLQNQSDKPITVRLRVAGFYTQIPGQAGTPVKE